MARGRECVSCCPLFHITECLINIAAGGSRISTVRFLLLVFFGTGKVLGIVHFCVFVSFVISFLYCFCGRRKEGRQLELDS